MKYPSIAINSRRIEMKTPLFLGFKRFSFVLIMLASMLCSACNNVSFKLPNSNTVTTVKIKSVPLKIVMAAGTAALQVALEEFAGVQIDSKDLLKQVSGDDVIAGVPPTDAPVLMVISKKTNDMMYWRLTDKVKAIRLKDDKPGAIELRVLNETPLRIELWIEGDIKEVKIEAEMKD